MKKTLLMLAVLLSAISCTNAQNKFSKKTLNSNLQTTADATVTFESIIQKHKGKTIVLEFWASWCSDCVKAMPRVKQLQSDNPNVAYVFISLDKSHEKFLNGIQKHELQGDNYWDSDPEGMKGVFGKSLKLNWIPRYIIVDKTGKIALFKAIETDFDLIDKTIKTLN